MPAFALFGIENDTVGTVVNLLVLFLLVLWLALVFWTYKDAVRRIGDPILVTTATLTSFVFPFVGTIVYLILRPPEFLEDVRERELEIAASEARLLQMHELACPFCAYPVEKTFLRCPSCLKRLKEPCATCRKPLDPRWQICPYCEAEVGQPAPQRRRRRPSERSRAVPTQPAQGERAPARPTPSSQPAPSQPSPAPPARASQPAPEGRGPQRPAGDPAQRDGETGRPTVARPGPTSAG